jgi:hypothetical protein
VQAAVVPATSPTAVDVVAVVLDAGTGSLADRAPLTPGGHR